MRLTVALFALAGLLSTAPHALAQNDPVPSTCLAVAEAFPKATYASFSLAQAVEDDAVTMTYAGHSTYVIETPAGVRIATDFSGIYAPIRCRASSP